MTAKELDETFAMLKRSFQPPPQPQQPYSAYPETTAPEGGLAANGAPQAQTQTPVPPDIPPAPGLPPGQSQGMPPEAAQAIGEIGAAISEIARSVESIITRLSASEEAVRRAETIASTLDARMKVIEKAIMDTPPIIPTSAR